MRLEDIPLNPTFLPQAEPVDGYISFRGTVWCGICADWSDLVDATNKRSSARVAKAKGWKLTRAKGWLCPRCQVST